MSLNSINIENGGFVPSGPPEITSIVDLGNGTISLTWNSKTSVAYAIQSSQTLEEGSWQAVTEGITADGATKTLSVNTGGDKLFYRVVEQ